MYLFPICFEISTDPVTSAVVNEIDLELDECYLDPVVIYQTIRRQGYGINYGVLSFYLNGISEGEGCVLRDWLLPLDIQCNLELDEIRRHS